MRHEWSLFGLHKLVLLGDRLPELKELLGSNLSLETTTVDEHKTRFDLAQEQEDGINRFIMFFDEKMRIPMILCYTGDEYWIVLFCSWLKAQGVIIWSVELNKQAMLEIADTVAGFQCYDTKFLFDVSTTDRNLKKIELEVDKASFGILRSDLSTPTALKDRVVPYIYQRSGMVLTRLPLAMISFTGAASVTRNKIVTGSWNDSILTKLLDYVQ